MSFKFKLVTKRTCIFTISFTLSISLIIFLSLWFIINYNKNQISPSSTEIEIMNKFFNNRSIKRPDDILFVQNKVISEIKHEYTGSEKLDVKKTILRKKGFCYDRSILMQKYFILNGYNVRPVYLYFGEKSTSVLDFFKKETLSHNVFEVYFQGKWILIRTNTKMTKLESLKEYIKSNGVVPPHTKYVRYLNNRNGKFIYPNFIPDIY